MLYGNLDCYNGINPYVPTQLQMGIKPITITHTEFKPSSTNGNLGLLFVYGENFTQYSKIYVNDIFYNTIQLDENTLIATIDKIETNDKINVIQSGKDMYELSRTDDYIHQ